LKEGIELNKLPFVENLNEAVHEVLQGKHSSKYLSKFYKEMILSSSHEDDLRQACIKYIEKSHTPNALSKIYTVFKKDPYVITIEDFIVAYGREWGFSNHAIHKAKERVRMYNEAAGHIRYISE
jgi:hypothetical protein